MLQKEKKSLRRCVICAEEIELDDDLVGICGGTPPGLETMVCVMHQGKCEEKLKSAQEGNDQLNGAILGLCKWCSKPVRNSNDFIVLRNDENEKSQSWFTSTLPTEGELSFAHSQCNDRVEACLKKLRKAKKSAKSNS